MSDFEQYWSANAVKHTDGPSALNNAFKEIALKAWNASRLEATQQRDELLEALERVCAPNCSMGDVDYARKVITKVKGAL